MEQRRFRFYQARGCGDRSRTWYIEVALAPEVSALRRGLDLGMTHIDTARCTAAEEVVAEAIAGRRDEVFLVSRFFPKCFSSGTIAACEVARSTSN